MSSTPESLSRLNAPANSPRETPGDVLLRHFATIGDWSNEDAAALSAVPARVIEVERHQNLLAIGDRPNHIIVVLRGWLYRHSCARNGTRQVQGFYMPEDAPCLETLHISRLDHHLTAMSAARIALIAHADIRRVLDSRPTLLHLAWRDTLIMGSMVREWLSRNGRMDAASALAHLFCEVMTRAKAAGLAQSYACDFPATQGMLGDALALTSVHINRTLQLLRQTGLVEFSGGRLIIHDFRKLAELGEFDPQYLHLRA